MNMSIFRKAKDDTEKSDRHQAIHQEWKKDIFVPLIHKITSVMTHDFWIRLALKSGFINIIIWILKRKIGKYMIKEYNDIPNDGFNRNFQSLYESFELGIKDWVMTFYGGITNGEKSERYQECEEKYKTRHGEHWYNIPKFFINLLMTVILEDTAYREQLNFILNRLQGTMNLKNDPKIQHKFPLYINIYDSFMPFFIEWKRVCGGGQILVNVDPNGTGVPPPYENVKSMRIPFSLETAQKIRGLDPNLRKKFYIDMDRFFWKMLPSIKQEKQAGPAEPSKEG